MREARGVRFDESTIPSIIADVGDEAAPFTLIATHPVPPKGGRLSARRNQQLAGLAARRATPPRPSSSSAT